MEIQALRDHSMIEIAVSLLDDTPVKASVSAWTTCSELLKIMSGKLGIRKTDAFALFETSNFHEERVVEGDERVLDLYALWERTGTEKEPKKQKKKSSKKQADERSYKLVFKVYLWIDFDNELVEEVSIVYLQAVHNIVRGIYACSLEKCIELASYQLYCRHGEHQPSSDQQVDLLYVAFFVVLNCELLLFTCSQIGACDELLGPTSSSTYLETCLVQRTTSASVSR